MIAFADVDLLINQRLKVLNILDKYISNFHKSLLNLEVDKILVSKGYCG